jgi:cyclase
MKRAGPATVFSSLVLLAFLRTAGSQTPLTQPLADGVYWRAAEPEKHIIANSGWVVFRDWVVVIDANFPWGARAILDDLRQTTNKPVRYVFATHYHSDHTFGNSLFVDAGAAIIASREALAESRENNPIAWKAAQAPGQPPLDGARLEHPQISFEDRLVIDDGVRRMELIKMGPAHTRGDAVAYLPKERIVFSGDLCVNHAGQFLGDPGADPDNWVRALDALGYMDVATLVPGHGNLGSHETLRGQRQFIADLVSGVRAGMARGLTTGQMESEIDLSRHNPWGRDKERNRAAVRAIHARLARR